MSVFSAIDNNKTKVLGVVTTVLGFIQAYPGLKDMLNPTAYGWTMFVIGILVTACGVWNTYQTNQAGNAAPPKSHWLIGLAIIIAASILLVGCTTAPAAASREACARDAAYSPIRCAAGVAEEYSIYQESMLRLVQDPGVDPEVKKVLRRTDAALTPVMVAGLQLTRDYRAISAALAAGESEEDQLRIANANIESWLVSALPKLTAMREALGL